LSDDQVEERINDSITFSKFISLGFEHTAPDHCTISRFRTALTELGLMDKLMRELNKQFKKYNIDRGSEGVIVDATIVDSPYHPHLPKNLVIAGDREDTRSELQKLDEVVYHAELKYTGSSIDHEARWGSRGKVSRFGFKHHVVTDPNGIVLSVLTTPANVTDTTMFKPLLDTVDLPLATPVLADKGYESKSNSNYLRAHHCTDGIMYKKPKGDSVSVKHAAIGGSVLVGMLSSAPLGAFTFGLGAVGHATAVLPRRIYAGHLGIYGLQHEADASLRDTGV
jgi:transposase DDE domain